MFRASKLAWLVLPLLALVECGARTELETAERCGESGTVRGCNNSCGTGTETCADGYWGACEVPVVTESCSGVCGAGVVTCENDHRGACLTPVATRDCSNDCGAGQEICDNSAWQGCVVAPTQRDCSSVCGSGHETCTAGVWNACDAPQPKPPVLHTTVRDFHKTQSDFELPVFGDILDFGMVEERLGDDQKPVYAGNPVTPTTPSGKAGFDVWYRNTPAVNGMPAVNDWKTINLQLTAAPDTPGLFVYDDQKFFPIDDDLFGNEGYGHNFHFTLETHTEFVYRGGETFTFAGDDDVWVFIAKQLAIDLGGLHRTLTKSVDLDAFAKKYCLSVGQKYPLDLFFAERHTFESHFTVRTTIADVGSCQ